MGRASRRKRRSVGEGRAEETRGVPVVQAPVPGSSEQSAASTPTPVHFLRRLGTLLPAATVILAAVLALRRLGDPDTWWHLASGRWIAEHHAIQRTDTFSYTVPDHPWINLQWLFDLFVYSLYRAGGPNLVVVAAAVLYATGTALLLKNLRLALGPVAAAVMGLWVLAITQGRFTIRPEMASFIFLPIVLWVCATGIRTGARRLWLLPAVMVLWVNTHSLFVIGGLIIGCYMAAGVANRLRLAPPAWRESIEPSALRTMLLSGTLALCATLANPYGLEGALFPLKLMTRLSGEAPAFQRIGELRRSFSPEAVNFAVRAYKAFFFFSVAVVGIALLVTALARQPKGGERRSERRRRQRLETGDRDEVSDGQPAEAKSAGLDLGGIVIFAGFACMSTLARRNMALFALVTAPFVGQCLATLGRRLSAAWRSETRDVLAAAAVAVLLPVLVLAGWFVASNNFYRWDAQPLEFGSGLFEVGSPVKASAFVKEQKLSPPLYNDWTSGGYLTWDRPVPGGVYLDSRGEVYDDQFFSNYLDQLKYPAKWQNEADQRGFQTVIFCHWWPGSRHLLTWLIRDPRWMLVYFDENTTVFVRRKGNEWLIEKALAEFQPVQEKQVQALLGPVSSWQWPAGRARALLAYGSLLDAMGRSREAVPLFERLLEIGQSRKEESWTAVRLGNHYAAIGQTERARAFLDRAAHADPDNPDIAPLRKRVGW